MCETRNATYLCNSRACKARVRVNGKRILPTNFKQLINIPKTYLPQNTAGFHFPRRNTPWPGIYRDWPSRALSRQGTCTCVHSRDQTTWLKRTDETYKNCRHGNTSPMSIPLLIRVKLPKCKVNLASSLFKKAHLGISKSFSVRLYQGIYMNIHERACLLILTRVFSSFNLFDNPQHIFIWN